MVRPLSSNGVQGPRGPASVLRQRALASVLLSCSLGAALAVAAASKPAAAATTDACQGAMTTSAMAECTAAENKAWDQRLNKAYEALKTRIDAGQRTPLLDAQRLWIRYRNANCGFYGMSEGTIGRVDAAECLRRVTRARACELEGARHQEAQPAADCKP